MAFAWDESAPVGSLGGLHRPACRVDPTPWGRQVRKLCRAAAEGGSPGGGILQGGAAWCLRDPGSGLCSLVEPQGVPVGRSGTVSLEDSPLILEVGAEGGSWAGCRVQAACWDGGGR